MGIMMSACSEHRRKWPFGRFPNRKASTAIGLALVLIWCYLVTYGYKEGGFDDGAMERLTASSLRTMVEFAKLGETHKKGYIHHKNYTQSSLIREIALKTHPDYKRTYDEINFRYSQRSGQISDWKNQKRDKYCSVIPEDLSLRGEIELNLTVPSIHDLEIRHRELSAGGHWEPKDCIPRHNVAIIIPYRDRPKQLHLLLQHLHPFLQKQKLNYTIYVLEQVPGKVFNRGLARNIGFIESQTLDPHHECTYFHDVDLLPVDDRNMYTCPEQPRHVCVAVDYYENYKPLYLDDYAVFGGVTALRNDHFLQINGYSNIYIGWGAEDDDLHRRIRANGLSVFRYPDHIGRYYGVHHVSEYDKPPPSNITNTVSRFKLLNLADMLIDVDGLSTSDYKIIKTTKEKLYTHILFDVEQDKYLKQAIIKDGLYDQLYNTLTPYWKNLEYIPPPYWWTNAEIKERFNRLNGVKWWTFW